MPKCPLHSSASDRLRSETCGDLPGALRIPQPHRHCPPLCPWHGWAEPSFSQPQHSPCHLTHLTLPGKGCRAGSSFPSPARQHGPRTGVGRAGSEVLPALAYIFHMRGARHRAAHGRGPPCSQPTAHSTGQSDSPSSQPARWAPCIPPTAAPLPSRGTHTPPPRVAALLSSPHPVWLRRALPTAPWPSRPPSPPLGTRARCSPEPANTNSIAWADPSPHGHACTDITGRTEPRPVGTFSLGWAASLERGWDRGVLGKEKVLDWPVGHRTSWSGHSGRELGAQSSTGEAGPMGSRSPVQHPPAPVCCSSLPGAFTVAAQGRTWVPEPQAAR